MKNLPKLAYVAVFFLYGFAHAENLTFTDWAIACDNTRHCEAVGYQAQDAETAPVTLFLERDAGQATQLKAKIMVQTPEDDGMPGKLSFKVGKLTIKGLKSEGDLTALQINQLLPQMLNAEEASITDGKHEWKLSLAGLKAALLKMDEKQGRIGTPGALVRKGLKPELSVLMPMPAPLLKAAKLIPPKVGDEKLLGVILKSVKDRQCWEELPDDSSVQTAIYRLTEKQVMVMRECGRGAYQGHSGLWIANDKPPHAPRRVLFPVSATDNEDYVMNAEFADGVMSSVAKGRGIGDCMSSMSWLWTVEGFKQLAAETSAFCRGIPGGGYNLRTWIAKQVK